MIHIYSEEQTTHIFWANRVLVIFVFFIMLIHVETSLDSIQQTCDNKWNFALWNLITTVILQIIITWLLQTQDYSKKYRCEVCHGLFFTYTTEPLWLSVSVPACQSLADRMTFSDQYSSVVKPISLKSVSNNVQNFQKQRWRESEMVTKPHKPMA